MRHSTPTKENSKENQSNILENHHEHRNLDVGHIPTKICVNIDLDDNFCNKATF